MHVKNLQVLAAALALAGAAGACGGADQAPPSSAATSAGRRVDPATAGTVTGRILFDGPVPANPPIQLAADPVCLRENKDGATLDTFVVDDGGLENVFVYVKDGLADYQFDVPTEAVRLDQQGCRYNPHVFGARAGQPIEVVNSDPTLHNVHALPDVNREVNIGQAVEGRTDTITFTAREVMIRFKCDVHGWMSAYVGVLDHPYFAVSANGGRFSLKDLPPGTYTIEAWHEKLGTQTETVTIGEKESKDISFTFRRSTTN